jgi:hypothetical protein
MMALPPKYVRRATILNATTHSITLLAQFKDNQATFQVAPNASVDIEGTIDHGSYTAVDPLQKITITHGADNAVVSERLFESEGGVKILSFRITGEPSTGIQWEEVPQAE